MDRGTTLTKKTAEELIASGKCRHTVRVCGNPDAGHYTTKYELDIQIGVEVVEYHIYDGAPVSEIPNTDSEVFYGAKVKALAAELYGVGVVSVKRIQEIISGITNGILNISAGAVYGFCRKLSELAAPGLRQIEECILDGTSAYTDAPGLFAAALPSASAAETGNAVSSIQAASAIEAAAFNLFFI